MKSHLSIFFFLLLSTIIRAEDRWQPILSMPFVYQDYQKSFIETKGGQKLQVESNIHIGHGTLWYKSINKNQYLEVKKGIIKSVTFSNNDKYIGIKDKLYQIIREDTLSSKTYRLLHIEKVDMPTYEDLIRNKRMAEGSSSLDIIGLNDMNLDYSVRNSVTAEEQELLPTLHVYYIQIDDEIFEATTSNILKHLANKEERKAYLTYMRRAEIITGELKSMLDIYTTFFIK